MQSISGMLGRFVCGNSYGSLPPAVIEKTKTCLIHAIGVGLAAYETETAQNAIETARGLGGDDATILVDGARGGLQNVALANGTMLHSRAQEDDYHPGMIHIGVVVIPAALAVSEAGHIGGREFLAAVALGYEVAARLSQGYAFRSSARGFRATSQYGVVGAAAAVSKLLKLNEDQVCHALGWAANLSCGLLECSLAKTPEMPFQAGFASANGITAAMVARTGAASAGTIFEGERGFYHAFISPDEDLAPITRDLGSRYEMLDTFFKPYPVGGLAQTPTAAMLELVQKHGIKPDQVTGVTIDMSPLEASYPGADSLKPGLVSVQFCTAVACVHRKITLATISRLDDPDVLRFMPKVKIVPDEQLRPLSCRMTVKMKDGRVFDKDASNVSQQDYCFSLDRDIELIRSLLPEMALPQDRVGQAISLVKGLEGCQDIGQLVQLLVSPVKVKAARYVLPF
ncbi:MAG: MmgE/PrpD family protein [Chloroflexota bacterium]